MKAKEHISTHIMREQPSLLKVRFIMRHEHFYFIIVHVYSREQPQTAVWCNLIIIKGLVPRPARFRLKQCIFLCLFMVDTSNGDVNQEYDVYVHEHTPKIFILAIVYLFADKIRPVG